MGVYDIDGAKVLHPYRIDGQETPTAYDINGTLKHPDTVQTITVMTFNVGCFYTEYFPAPSSAGNVFLQRQRNIFGKYDTDFAGLSEWYNKIGDIPSSTLMDGFFESYYPEYVYPTAGAALTSAFSTTPSDITLVQYQTQGSSNRYYQKAHVRFGDKTVCCILTHLELSDSIRAAQFLEVLSAVQNEEYFIILGDFNFQITAIGDSEYNKSVKIALDRGYHSAQNGNGILMTYYSGTTVANSSSVWALDNIITSPNINITNVIRDETKLTDGLCTDYDIHIDHLPLVATLQLI